MPPTIAVLTDFGTQDPYVGIMKGVMARIAPSAVVVDVSHGVPPQDVLVGALWLDGAWDWFPDDAIFLCVVDPGVGSARRVVACDFGGRRYVGPDNGLLSAVLQRHSPCLAVVASDPRFHLPGGSSTFHGRDIMSPVAAHLAAAVPLEALGPPAGALERLALPRSRHAMDMVVGEVIYVDHFGNLITSILGSELPASSEIRVGEGSVPLVRTYAQVQPGEALALVGSTGRLEISVRDGSAARVLELGPGDAVIVVEASA
jgi:S-adenosyl-L-methionine hydrolase (adenosine-forming)